MPSLSLSSLPVEALSLALCRKYGDRSAVVAARRRRSLHVRKINNNSWTLVKGDKDSGINFMEVEIHKGKLYAITDDKLNSLLVYDLQQQQSKPIILAKLPYNDITHRNKFQHLAVDASREELFLVRHNMETSGDRIVVKCQVSKLRMVDDKWTQVDDLGDRLLFVGEYKSLVVSSQSDFVLHGHRRFHPPMSYNCVCFGSSGFGKYLARGKEGMMRFSFDVYCLTDQSMTIHNLLFTNICDFEDKSPPPPIWFTPSV
ncbi:putative F-box domain-containing protein [Senna tora]|uniref:Putative F-box domain-containing protein n=1 Tax=Senna tora TaxID=362788 RepID=A0A834WVU7_9FABA|nr:putative F-box domain-containing protein [Senna tora]